MTDNRTTELRRLLDERGFGYKPTRFSMLQTTFTANGVEWIVTEREATGELFVEPRHGLTPEQAIAATLGSEREKALEELVQDWQALYEYPDYGDCIRLRKRMQELGIEVVDE